MNVGRLLLKVLLSPFKLIWWATTPRKFPHGKPFDIRKPLVIDGDTLFHNGMKIRIWGIDAPETGERNGRAAKQYLQNLIAPRLLHVVPKDVDVYGRTVAQVFSGRGDIGQQMVAGGYAIAKTSEYRKDEQRARSAKAGLWNRGGITDPSTWRKNNAA